MPSRTLPAWCTCGCLRRWWSWWLRPAWSWVWGRKTFQRSTLWILFKIFYLNSVYINKKYWQIFKMISLRRLLAYGNTLKVAQIKRLKHHSQVSVLLSLCSASMSICVLVASRSTLWLCSLRLSSLSTLTSCSRSCVSPVCCASWLFFRMHTEWRTSAQRTSTTASSTNSSKTVKPKSVTKKLLNADETQSAKCKNCQRKRRPSRRKLNRNCTTHSRRSASSLRKRHKTKWTLKTCSRTSTWRTTSTRHQTCLMASSKEQFYIIYSLLFLILKIYFIFELSI